VRCFVDVRSNHDPMTVCDFHEKRPDGKWVCSKCRRPSISSGDRPPKRACLIRVIENSPVCRMANVVSLLTSEGVDGLQRCRADDCRLMHNVDGQIACTGMQGKRCGWIAKWADCLNGETTFPNGTSDCPHWTS